MERPLPSSTRGFEKTPEHHIKSPLILGILFFKLVNDRTPEHHIKKSHLQWELKRFTYLGILFFKLVKSSLHLLSLIRTLYLLNSTHLLFKLNNCETSLIFRSQMSLFHSYCISLFSLSNRLLGIQSPKATYNLTIKGFQSWLDQTLYPSVGVKV